MRDRARRRRRTPRVRGLGLALLPLALATACGATDPEREGAATPPARTEPADTLYETTATVLEAKGRRPMLCLAGVATSLPPQCGNVPVANWSWEEVEGEEALGGTTWGDYHVVGTYDGETFALVKAGPPEWDENATAPEPDFTPPCPEPAGGWRVPDPEASTQMQVDAAQAYAMRQPEYVASWVDHLDDAGGRPQIEEELPVVYVAVFARRAGRHEAEIRERWSGPLCVVERSLPTAREAARIRREAEGMLDDRGLELLWSSEGTYEQAADIGVVLDAGGAAQAAFDERFGRGVVRVFSALRPVS